MLNFTKIVGSGNDFIVIDARHNKINDDIKSLAKNLCDRRLGIGADGLLLLEKSSAADFKMRIINADGSEAEMCGNGARCIAYFAYMQNKTKSNLSIETLAGIIEAYCDNDNIKIRMPKPHSIYFNIKLDVTGYGEVVTSFINTGVPHAVIFVNDIESIDVKSFGSLIRNHSYFSPRGTNVNFVKIIDKDTIEVRTYERGVEDETLSCGSGSTGSAIISSLNKNVLQPVNVKTRSGEILKIYFEKTNNQKELVVNVFLEGKVKKVFEGKIEFGGKNGI